MRRKLIEADLIECVLGLGPNLFYNSPMEACVVICRTAKPKARRNKILFINAVGEVTRERAQSFLTDDHIQRIVQAYEQFTDEPGFTRVATLEEIRAKDGSLNIPLYVAAPASSNTLAMREGQADYCTDSLPQALDAWSASRKAVAESLSTILPGLKLPNLDETLNGIANRALFDRKGWQRVRFGDVVKMLKEQVDPQSGEVERYVAGEHMETENVHIRKWGTVGDGYLGPAFIRRFRKGQVLYGSRRTYLKKVAVAEWDGVTSNTTFVLEAVEGKLLQELLPWLMLSEAFTKHSILESKGSTNPYINFPDIAKFEFDLPPIEQQRRFAEVLWAMDFYCISTDDVLTKIIQYRRSFLDSVAQKYSYLHALVPLDSIISAGRPICYGILKPGLGVDKGIPVIKVRDFPDGSILADDLLLTTQEIETPFKRSRLKAGDLLLSIRGTIGRLAEVPDCLEGANITQDTARLSISSEHNRYYIRAVLESEFVKNQILSRITGLAVKGINICEVRKLQIPIPNRITQDEIAFQLEIFAVAQKSTTNLLRQQLPLKSHLLDIIKNHLLIQKRREHWLSS